MVFQSKRFSLFYISIFFLFFFIPALLLVLNLSSSNFSELVSGKFLLILSRSIAFAALEALLSSLLSVLASVLLIFFFLNTSWIRQLFPLFKIGGLFLFCLSGVAHSLIYLKFTRVVDIFPSFGLFPIIFVHVVMNQLFLSSVLLEEYGPWWIQKGRSLFQSSIQLGMKPIQGWLFVTYHQFKTRIKTWAVLIFFWAISSFSVVLILGGGAEYSTPEVLLFYTILGEFNFLQAAMIFGGQFFLLFLVLKFLSLRKSEASGAGSYGIDYHSLKLNILNTRLSRCGFVMTSLPSAIVLIFVSSTLLSFESYRFFLDSEFQGAIFRSIMLASICFFGVLVGVIFSALLSETYTRRFFLFVLFSPIIVGALYYETLSIVDNSWIDRLILTLIPAMVITFTQLPWLIWEFSRRRQNIDQKLEMTSLQLGMKRWHFLFQFIFPYFKKSILWMAFFVFLMALSDVGLTSLFWPAKSSLGSYAKWSADSYAFEAGNAVLVVIFLATMIFVYCDRKTSSNVAL